MRLYSISTGWIRAIPGSSAFLDGWAALMNSLLGRWGMDDWEWSANQLGTWRLIKGMCLFSVKASPGDYSFKLPFIPSTDNVLVISDLVTSNVKNLSILSGMESIDIHLDNESIITSIYETEK